MLTLMAKDADFLRAVGERLTQTREALRFNQTAAAQAFGVQRAAWNHYENGRRMLDIQLASAICDRWGVTLDWLYRGDKSGLTMRMVARLEDLLPVLKTTEEDDSQPI